MSTSTKVGLGILAGLAVYLIYRMFSGYNQAPVSASGTTASNLQSAGAPTAPQGLDYTVMTVPPPSAGLPSQPSRPSFVPKIAPSTGLSVEARKGAGHF